MRSRPEDINSKIAIILILLSIIVLAFMLVDYYNDRSCDYELSRAWQEANQQ